MKRKSIAKFAQEFRGARTMAATALHLSVLVPPLFLLALLAVGMFYATGNHSHLSAGNQLTASLGFVAIGGVIEEKDFFGLKEQFGKIEKSLEGFISKYNEEMKTSGSASTETKSAVDKLAKEATEIANRMLAVEQKLTVKGGEEKMVKSIGELVVEHEAFKSVAAGGRSTGPINVGSMFKTAMVNATGQNQPLVPAYRIPGVITPATQRLTVRDLFPSVPTSSNSIEYVIEKTFTNAAAVQGAASSPQVYENVAKAESAMTFEMSFQPVQTIAHWIPISRQLLADAPAIQGYINARLTYGLKLKEETELLSGTGTGASIKGVITCATAYETTRDGSGDTMNDTIRHAIAQADASFYPSDFVVLNPADWEKIELLKTTGTASSGEYLASDPTAVNTKRRWGKVIVDTPSITAGKFLVGSSMAATIWDRQNATIEVSREHSDYFVKNMAAILCEERLGLTVQVPAALIYGSFPS